MERVDSLYKSVGFEFDNYKMMQSALLTPTLLFREFLLDSEKVVQLPSRTVLQDEIEFLLRLEGSQHADDEGMVELG